MTAETKTYRSTLNRLLAIAVAVVAAGILAAQVAANWVSVLTTGIPAAALAAYLGWLLFWAPSVTMSSEGLVVRNIVRSYDIRWSAVQEVGVGMALVVTAANTRVTAWAAPSGSAGASRYGRGGAYSRMGTDSGYIANLVRTRWFELNRSGTVPKAVTGEPGFTKRWLPNHIIVLAVLVAATVVCAIVFGR